MSSSRVLRGRRWNRPLQSTGSLTQSSGTIQQSSAPVPQSTGAFPLSSVATRHAATPSPVKIRLNMILERTLNQVTLLGRVGGDPIKKGTIEHPMAEFSITTHSSYKNEEGEETQNTDWHRICVFEPSLIEQVFRFLKRGQRVHITGKIVYSPPEQDNVTQYRVSSIYADQITFFQGSPADDEFYQ